MLVDVEMSAYSYQVYQEERWRGGFRFRRMRLYNSVGLQIHFHNSALCIRPVVLASLRDDRTMATTRQRRRRSRVTNKMHTFRRRYTYNISPAETNKRWATFRFFSSAAPLLPLNGTSKNDRTMEKWRRYIHVQLEVQNYSQRL